MKKISIIMPLYNAEKYLEECINSVLSQTLTDFELLCINDASTDSTLDILEQFQKRDSRIRILSNMERRGAAYSRNRGIGEAEGHYLSFLDGDDIFDERMLETAYQAAIGCMADVVMYEYAHVASESIYNKLDVYHSGQYKQRYCKKPFRIQDYEPYEWLNWGLSPCNKLYRKEFIRDNHLIFQDLPSSNDVYFVCMALLLSEKIVQIDDGRVMLYARDHNEETRISADRDPQCAYQAFLHFAEELKGRGLFSDLYSYFYYRFFRALKSVLRQCRTEEKARNFYQFLQEEGIDRIRLIGEAYYDKLDDFIKDSIGQFKKLPYESGWYQEELGLKMELSQKGNAEAVIELFERFVRVQKKIGIWGAGANGISVLAFCRENNLPVDMVIDKSKTKQGRRISGYQIKPPEDISDNLQVILVSTRYIAESVRKELSGRNIEVIDLNEYLYVY